MPYVAKLFRSLAYENKDRLMAGLIVAGWDALDGGSVWEIPLGGSCVKQPFAIGACVCGRGRERGFGFATG